MAQYLVIHAPGAEESEIVYPPSDLAGLAALTGTTRWVTTFSPDLHDDRHFSLWVSDSAAEIEAVMETFRFMPDRDSTIVRVHAWGPEDVVAASDS